MTAYVIILAVALVGAALAVTRPRNGAGLTWLTGMALIYLGQRMFAGDAGEMPATVVGLVVVLAAFGVRGRALAGTSGATADTMRTAIVWQGIATSSLLLWALTTDTVTTAFGLEGEAYDRWTVSLTALFPIVAIVGAVPMLLVDQVLGAHPVAMPDGAARRASQAGLALALGGALVFPLNYLADAHDVDADFSYFRTTEAGSSTLALVRNLEEPVEILLFYPPASDVKEELVRYTKALVDAGEGNVKVEVIDQPMAPDLAKELTVRDNGYVVLKMGERNQKFKIDTDMKRARRELKRLDGTMQKHLLKLAKDKRRIYLLTGHEEATPRDDDPFLKLGEFKKLLSAQNHEVKDFGLEQGSADAVPEDAALVVVAAPAKELLPEETAALEAYVDGGGALLVYADPGRDPMTELLGHVGVKAGTAPLAHASKIVPMRGGLVDRLNLYSQRFGTHAATATLSKYSDRAPVVLPSVVAIDETGATAAPGPAKHTPLIRSYEETWADTTPNFARDADEPGAVQVLAMAVQGPDSAPYRVIVVGDVSVASDFVLRRSQGAAQFAYDSVRWLVGDEELAGEVSNEEDVRIEHTREEDQLWFYGTIFGVPLLVLLVGGISTRRRRAA